MKICAYIDGFNLYYLALKHRPDCKWLDLDALCRCFSGDAPDISLTIKYFTARLLTRGDAPKLPKKRQETYLRALGTLPNLEIIMGQYEKRTKKGYCQKTSQIEEIKTYEEKGSDVNLAVHLVKDCYEDNFDRALVISNDSDLAEALKVTKAKGKLIILLSPNRKKCPHKLKQYASKMLDIRQSHLLKSQFPPSIALANGRTLDNPEIWRTREDSNP